MFRGMKQSDFTELILLLLCYLDLESSFRK